MFNHLDIDLPKLERETIDSVRYYTISEENEVLKLVSITSVTSHFNKEIFVKWRKKVGDEEGSKDLHAFAGNINQYREFAKKGETRELPAPFVVKYYTKKNDKDYVLIGGFKRSSIALEMGIEPIKVWLIDLTK